MIFENQRSDTLKGINAYYVKLNILRHDNKLYYELKE